ncbi:MAG TPA: hypothetical protein ENK47_07345 [Euryarchaeota archaeon]|nr:MAG: hypothetical protein B6U90_01250 [Thermoplasmatales archaeon ex4484_6]RLF68283.1 MAG: hypothetical protein DRN57_04510 [Thermoplasmata archaeon]HHD16508.1 hypothetical protein [Euryarchaeota archaeon]
MEAPARKRTSYRIPGEDLVSEAIREILNEAFTVRSQTLFHRLVLAKLREKEPDRYRLSPARLRRIAARMEDVDLIIHCREDRKKNRSSTCPVCGMKMEDVKNSTLYGWTVATGKVCPTCSYWTGSRKRIPTRYVFTREKEKYLGEKMEGA